MWRGLPARTDFSLLIENEEWMVVGKPAPLIVHPTNNRPEVTLLGEMEKRWPGERFHFVNRLDRETSGCVLVAKTKEAAGFFGRQMMERKIKKVYRAIVKGWPDWDELEGNRPLIRKGEVEESLIWVRQMVHSEGKESCTKFRCLERFERKRQRYAIVECVPLTGRTHQIRVHLEDVGFPIVGDKIYGGNEECYLNFIEEGWSQNLLESLLIDRQALHGSGMKFEWQGEEVEATCPWPEELKQFQLGVAPPSVLDSPHADDV